MEKWEAALKDYQAGMKYQEIADKYGVSLSAVKSWASRKWKQKAQKKVATKTRKKLQPSNEKSQPKKRPGAPPGNRNAVGNRGGGAPPGNRNNYRHGFFIDVLSEEERQMIENRGEISEDQHLVNQINLLEIRERHLLRHIEDQRAVASGLAVRSVTRSDESTVRLTSTLENIKDLEDKVTKVQQTYVRYIDLLHRIHREDGGEGDNSMDALMSILNAARGKEEDD